MHAQLFAQFMQPAPHSSGVTGLCGFILHRQIRQADRDNRSIDGLAFAVFLEQPQKAEPCGIVCLSITFLRGIAPGGIDQHRIIRKPPIAIARAAHTGGRLRLAILCQWELQTAVHNRRGLARTGRANNDVPRQLIKMRAPGFGSPQLDHRRLQLVAHLAQFF